MFLPADLKRCKLCAEIDGVTAAACRFPANGAITEIERVGMGRINAEIHAAAMAGTGQFHGDASIRLKKQDQCPDNGNVAQGQEYGC